MDKRGVLGLDMAKTFILAILTLSVIAFAVLIATNSLLQSNVLTGNSTSYNQSSAIFRNVSDGVSSLFSNAGTWFTLLAVVIIILIISVVIVAVNKFGSNRENL